MAPKNRGSRGKRAASPSPPNCSDSPEESPQSAAASGRGRKGEPARQRPRLVAERDDTVSETAVGLKKGREVAEDRVLPRFRHLGFVRQSQAACLVFCWLAHCDDADVTVQFVALPFELIELICRFIVVGTAVVRFSHPRQLEPKTELPGDRAVFSYEMTTFVAEDGNQYLASGTTSGHVLLWDISSRKCVATLQGHKDAVSCLATIPGSGGISLLASGSEDGTVILWEIASRQRHAEFSAHKGPVMALIYISKDGVLASGGYGIVKFWDLRTLTVVDAMDGVGPVSALAEFTDVSGVDSIAVASYDGNITVHCQDDVFTLGRSWGGVCCLTSFTNHDGISMLVSGCDDGAVDVWDMHDCENIAHFSNFSPARVLSVVCAAGYDGRVLLVASLADYGSDGVHILDIEPGQGVDMYIKSGPVIEVAVFSDRARGESVLAAGLGGSDAGAGDIQLLT
jgi:WD domain, G-beta repeat